VRSSGKHPENWRRKPNRRKPIQNVGLQGTQPDAGLNGVLTGLDPVSAFASLGERLSVDGPLNGTTLHGKTQDPLLMIGVTEQPGRHGSNADTLAWWPKHPQNGDGRPGANPHDVLQSAGLDGGRAGPDVVLAIESIDVTSRCNELHGSP
jgi:hypothetical protein